MDLLCHAKEFRLHFEDHRKVIIVGFKMRTQVGFVCLFFGKVHVKDEEITNTYES